LQVADINHNRIVITNAAQSICRSKKFWHSFC
jgi:hypothetical protein